MHILFAIQNLSQKLGGAERFSLNLVKNLKARGHRITVACYSKDAMASCLGAEFLTVKRPLKGQDPWEAYAANLNAELQKLPEGQRPDLVCGLTQFYPQDVHRFGGGIYAHWLPIKYGRLWWLKKFFLRNRKILEFERKLYSPENLRYAVAISEMDRRILESRYDFPKERILTIYNGIDQEEFNAQGREEARADICQKYSLDPKSRIVLFSANNYGRKGLPEAVKALLKTEDPSRFTLVVIGKPDKLLRTFLKWRIGRKFRNVWLSRVDNPAHFYKGCDIMLFPTRYDSFANVTAEALLCGLPLITTALCGGAEMVIPGRNGFVVKNSRETGAMAEALDTLLEEAALKEFSLHAPDLARNLTWEACAAKFEALFLKVLAEKSAAR